ncbi:MAG: hypothetical protein AB1544_05180 [Pseudomonadota bacterium]
MYWLLAFLVVVPLLGLTVYLRRRRAAREQAYLEALAAPVEKPVWGKRVVIPPQGPACQAVKNIANTDFKTAEAPQLPLHACTHKFTCQCTYRQLEEKRSGKERRDGIDRRPVVRYDPENPPRRGGCDRRADKNTPFNDRAI